MRALSRSNGEVIEVRAEARDWEGAVERVLHNFGLSLIVPDAAYGRVAEWVDRTHLGGRLVYFRVRSDSASDERANRTLDEHSLAGKLAIAPDSPYYAWLEVQLARRFDYICCDTLEQFRREFRAITRSGQIKGSNERHEKDDRRNIADRSQYILGWSNEAKIEALEKQRADLGVRLAAAGRRVALIGARRKAANDRLRIVEQLAAFESFRDVEWRPIAVAIADLEHERRELEEASDVLRTLQQQLAQTEANLLVVNADLTQRQDERSVVQEKRTQSGSMLDECNAVLDATHPDAQERYFPQLATMREEAQGELILSVESCDNRERDMRDWLQSKIDAEIKRGERLRDAIVRTMQEYRGQYPADAQELDAAVEAAPAYRLLLERLRSDDLPRFETRFKELLNENAIREIANFQSQLNRELQTTDERIESINRSLKEIEYNPKRYIVLESERTFDLEIRDFQRDLRSCTEGALTGSDEQGYAEEKFLQVKRIIGRFRGREGQGEIDRRWTRKVTDARNWQTFAASERYREDDSEHEHYTDSGGKSGGQKEKLAYTVLAASVAYQFGLDRAAGRSFRFVAIDEAFGSAAEMRAPDLGDDRLEPFVANVAYVANDGRESQLHNLTIEEFRAQRVARLG